MKNDIQDVTRPSKIEEEITSLIHESVVIIGMGIHHYFKLIMNIRKYYLFPIPFTMFLYWVSLHIAYSGAHLRALTEGFDMDVRVKIINWLSQFSVGHHALFIFCCFMFVFLVTLGIMLRMQRTKYQVMFQKIGLTNRLGDTPKLVHIKKINKFMSEYLFDSNGVGLDLFENKKSSLESEFNQSIEKIEHGDGQKYISIKMTPHTLSENVTYEELANKLILPKESFYLGASKEGPVSQKIEDLPHMLITGVTNAGKSVYFKQVLVGLLESSPHLQMYLIDLKKGLEFSDFKQAPNVKIFKSADSAANILQQIKNEMEERFKYMERNGLKKIIPEKHGFDRIVVAIDEASEMYMIKKSQKDAQMKTKAVELTDSLAKLARAAAIHLVFATQKIIKEVIPTTIQENISARVAFMANSLQGSLIVLGNRDALDLPSIKGRGLWKFGTEYKPIQGPYISGDEIETRCKAIRELFDKKERKLNSPLLGSVVVRKAKDTKKEIIDITKKKED